MIDVPGETQHVIVKGSVKWIRQKGNRFIGGIEFVALLDNVTFSKLS
jgi:hypothetical protein